MSQKLGNRRVTGTEQYYTPTSLANELTKELFRVCPQLRTRAFLEPAGGNGSFVDALKAQGIKNLSSVDLHPKHQDVKEQDFLSYFPEESGLVTISNPPFGRNNALSVPFFNHAANFSDYIAFLVPRSWRKWSVQNRLDLRFHLIHDQEVSVDYVTDTGEPFGDKNELRTCFQIWEKRKQTRPLIKVEDQKLVEKCEPERADLAIRVFGFGCGKVFFEFPRQSNTTLMFLRVLDQRVFDVIKGLDYERFYMNTAFTKALSLQEINFLLNEKILGDPFLENRS